MSYTASVNHVTDHVKRQADTLHCRDCGSGEIIVNATAEVLIGVTNGDVEKVCGLVVEIRDLLDGTGACSSCNSRNLSWPGY